MASYEDQLLKIIDPEGYWKAPNLGSLEYALAALEKALADLSQGNPESWSGEAAEQAAETFDDMRVRYGAMKRALQSIGDAIEAANQARDRAYNAFHDLPSGSVPSEVHDAVAVAKQAGKANVVIAGVSLVAEKAVSIVEGWMGDNREEEARLVLENLKVELEPAQAKLTAGGTQLDNSRSVRQHDDKRHGKDGGDDGGRGGPGPIPPRGRDPRPPGTPDDDLVWIGPGPDVPGPDLPPGEYPEDDWVRPPRVPDRPERPPIVISDPPPPTRWDPTPPPAPWDPTQPPTTGGPGTGTSPYPGPGTRPDVDSAGGGTIGGAGLAGGTLAGGAAAGAATLRWASQQRAAAAGRAGSPGGVGGILGANGARAGGAGTSGLVAPRGLAAGVGGGGGGAGLGAGAGAGARAGGASSGTPGAMMAGGAPGGGAGGGKKGQKSGLGGHIAPKIEDDDDFIPQSESARAGSRDELNGRGPRSKE